MLRRQTFTIGTLAAASLLLESTLTRLLAVAQFYHFAFLVVSLALLGYGASGSILFFITHKKSLTAAALNPFLFALAGGFTVCVGVAYALVNFLPFDSYSIAWDRRQLLFLGLYYLALTLPFLLAGLATGGMLAAIEGEKHLIYAANLLGSAAGTVLALAALALGGVPGGVLLSALLGIAAAVPVNPYRGLGKRRAGYGFAILLLAGFAFLGHLVLSNFRGQAGLGMVLSPYKGLAQARHVPGASPVFGQWNAFSRIDVVMNAGTHRFPGLSYTYPEALPQQAGLSVDADSLQPVTLVAPGEFTAARYLPEAVVFDLLPQADVLVIEPGGGLGVLQALAGDAQSVTAVMGNPLEVAAVGKCLGKDNLYAHPQVSLVNSTGRAFLARRQGSFDILFFPLADAYRPVASGAFSLSENFNLTVEAFRAAIELLDSNGVLVITRWLQTPPSESVRVFNTLVEAAQGSDGGEPDESFIAYRSIQTMTILFKPAGWEKAQIQAVRTFAEDRKFDLVWLPGIDPGEVNRHNRLPEPWYYLLVKDLLDPSQKERVIRSYPFDISAPTDDHPFFYHFFQWGQTAEIVASLGHTWQPFGGSGYLVLFALLALVLAISVALIILPLALGKGSTTPSQASLSFRQYLQVFAYFTCLGFAYLWIEIPLIQKAILSLGHPVYAFTTVVFAVLFFSGLGSAAARSRWIPPRAVMVLLPVMALSIALVFSRLSEISLGESLVVRGIVVLLALAPLAFLMGLPFPYGLAAVEPFGRGIVPWIWAVNGSVSVAASILAAILILSFGFKVVLLLGAGMYAAASVLYLLRLEPGNRRTKVSA